MRPYKNIIYHLQASEEGLSNSRVRDVDSCTPLHLTLLHGGNIVAGANDVAEIPDCLFFDNSQEGVRMHRF